MSDQIHAVRRSRTIVNRTARRGFNLVIHVVQSVLDLLLWIGAVASLGALIVAVVDMVGRSSGDDPVWPGLHDAAIGFPGGLLGLSVVGLCLCFLLVQLVDWISDRIRLSTAR